VRASVSSRHGRAANQAFFGDFWLREPVVSIGIDTRHSTLDVTGDGKDFGLLVGQHAVPVAIPTSEDPAATRRGVGKTPRRAPVTS
jgi:hypothetical protein